MLAAQAMTLHSHYAYGFVFALMLIGLYGMLFKRNLMKKVIGMTILQSAIILLWIVAAYREGGTVPITGKELPAGTAFSNPLPHTLMLTAIVVAVVTSGVAFALLIAIYRNYGTLDEPNLLEQVS